MEQGFDPLPVVMAHRNALSQIEDAVNAVLFRVTIVSLDVAFVSLKPHVADVKDAGLPQNARYFADNIVLSSIARHAREYG